MLTGKAIKRLLVAGLLSLFGLALWQLMQLRFQSGDIYPEYSSLRADPRGTKALFEALDRIPRLETQRHFLAPTRLRGDTNSTIFFLGVENDATVHESAETLETLAQDGARVVITWSSTSGYNGRSNTGPPPPKPKNPLQKKKEISILDHVATGIDTNHFDAEGRTLAQLNIENEQFPRTITWLSPRYFYEATNGWNVLYRVGTNAVLIEQKIGKGSILMATDSYFLSNEAMRHNRATEILAYFLHGTQSLIFSEWHLGIEHGTGIAVLARQYRLHGFALGLLLLVGFYIWRNAFPFVPIYEEEERNKTNEVASNKSAREAFLTLLQKNISKDQILQTCFQEWRKIELTGKRSMPEKRKEMELVILRQNDFPAKERDPVSGYKEMVAILEKEEP